MAGGLGRAFSVAIAAQFQALGILGLAWWAGGWLNENHPVAFNWYLVTFLLAVVVIAQTFYVLIRHLMQGESRTNKTSSTGEDHDASGSGGSP